MRIFHLDLRQTSRRAFCLKSEEVSVTFSSTSLRDFPLFFSFLVSCFVLTHHVCVSAVLLTRRLLIQRGDCLSFCISAAPHRTEAATAAEAALFFFNRPPSLSHLGVWVCSEYDSACLFMVSKSCLSVQSKWVISDCSTLVRNHSHYTLTHILY